MTLEEREYFEELFLERHTKAMRELADHFLKVFRGEVDVVGLKLERLRDRVDTLEKGAPEKPPVEHG